MKQTILTLRALVLVSLFVTQIASLAHADIIDLPDPDAANPIQEVPMKKPQAPQAAKTPEKEAAPKSASAPAKPTSASASKKKNSAAQEGRKKKYSTGYSRSFQAQIGQQVYYPVSRAGSDGGTIVALFEGGLAQIEHIESKEMVVKKIQDLHLVRLCDTEGKMCRGTRAMMIDEGQTLMIEIRGYSDEGVIARYDSKTYLLNAPPQALPRCTKFGVCQDEKAIILESLQYTEEVQLFAVSNEKDLAFIKDRWDRFSQISPRFIYRNVESRQAGPHKIGDRVIAYSKLDQEYRLGTISRIWDQRLIELTEERWNTRYFYDISEVSARLK